MLCDGSGFLVVVLVGGVGTRVSMDGWSSLSGRSSLLLAAGAVSAAMMGAVVVGVRDAILIHVEALAIDVAALMVDIVMGRPVGFLSNPLLCSLLLKASGSLVSFHCNKE